MSFDAPDSHALDDVEDLMVRAMLHERRRITRYLRKLGGRSALMVADIITGMPRPTIDIEET